MQRTERGFSLVELAAVVLIFGLLAAFAFPAMVRFRHSHEVVGAGDDIVAQIQLARTRAISTGVDQPMHFFYHTYGYDYHIHLAGVPTNRLPGWSLPKGVTYQWPVSSPMSFTLYRDGRCSNSLIIPLTNAEGSKDTVFVMTSGTVLSK